MGEETSQLTFRRFGTALKDIRHSEYKLDLTQIKFKVNIYQQFVGKKKSYLVRSSNGLDLCVFVCVCVCVKLALASFKFNQGSKFRCGKREPNQS